MTLRKVKYARLHSTTFVPDCGEIPVTLNAKASSADKSFQMWLEDTGFLRVEVTTKHGNRKVMACLPTSSVALLILDDAPTNS